MWGKICLCLALCSLSSVSAGRVKRAEKIKVTTIKEPPYLTVKSSGKGNDKFEGFIADLMKEIAKDIKIDYELHLVEDGKYGQVESDGQWSGMIGEVIRTKARIAAAPVTISTQRQGVVDFTEPFMKVDRTILVYKPPEGEPAVKNAQELADSDIKYGLIKDGMTHEFFKSATDPLHRKMWKFMEDHPEVMMENAEKAVKKVRESKGKYAFIMENTTAAYWIHKQPCDLQTVGGGISGTGHDYALVVRKGDTIKERLNGAIRKKKKVPTATLR